MISRELETEILRLYHADGWRIGMRGTTAMEPNDLPLVYLPMDLSDESSTSLLEFLHQLTETLERHYAGQLLRHAYRYEPESLPPDSQTNDPPFRRYPELSLAYRRWVTSSE